MERRQQRTIRQGRIYRFVINKLEYAAFIWKDGSRFRGRIEDHPQVPQCTGRTALLVRDALAAVLGGVDQVPVKPGK